MIQPSNHPSRSQLELDESVPHQTKESWRHWANKAATVNWLRSHGAIEPEKKVEDKIGDILCKCSQRPDGMPRRFVVEIPTELADKDVLKTTDRYHRFGFAVYWVFDVRAHQQRHDAETTLGEYMSSPASLGLIFVGDGELQLGQPITRERFDYTPDGRLARTEFYIPTYDRSEHHYDHGDFEVDGDRMTVYSIAGREEYYFSPVLDGGQRNLPQRALVSSAELYHGIQEGAIERVTPVRGAP